jgi:hypothetical protein
MTKFRRLASSSKGVSSSTLLPGRVTNVGTMGAFVDVVLALSDLGRVVWILGSTAMHFHPGWSGPARGFDHGGYHPGDGHYGDFGQ